MLSLLVPWREANNAKLNDCPSKTTHPFTTFRLTQSSQLALLHHKQIMSTTSATGPSRPSDSPQSTNNSDLHTNQNLTSRTMPADQHEQPPTTMQNENEDPATNAASEELKHTTITDKPSAERKDVAETTEPGIENFAEDKVMHETEASSTSPAPSDGHDEEMRERLSSPKKKRGRDQDDDGRTLREEDEERASSADGDVVNGSRSKRLERLEPEKKRVRDGSEELSAEVVKVDPSEVKACVFRSHFFYNILTFLCRNPKPQPGQAVPPPKRRRRRTMCWTSQLQRVYQKRNLRHQPPRSQVLDLLLWLVQPHLHLAPSELRNPVCLEADLLNLVLGRSLDRSHLPWRLREAQVQEVLVHWVEIKLHQALDLAVELRLVLVDLEVQALLVRRWAAALEGVLAQSSRASQLRYLLPQALPNRSRPLELQRVTKETALRRTRLKVVLGLRTRRQIQGTLRLKTRRKTNFKKVRPLLSHE